MPRWSGGSGRLSPNGTAWRCSRAWSVSTAMRCWAGAPNASGPMPTPPSPRRMTFSSSAIRRSLIPRSWLARTACRVGCLASRPTAGSMICRISRICEVPRTGLCRCGGGLSRSSPRCPYPGSRCTTCSCEGLWTAGTPLGNWAPTSPRLGGCGGRTATRYCALSRSPRTRRRKQRKTRRVARPPGAWNCG
jgi:hypothetical protein